MPDLPLPPPRRRSSSVLGLNLRNSKYILGLTPRVLYPVADDKILCKQALYAAGVPTPGVKMVLENLAEVSKARPGLERLGEFALKPARGRQGNGIVVIVAFEGGSFVTTAGERLGWETLRRMMGDILFGENGAGHSERVLIETRVRTHASMRALGAIGLPDIRVIVFEGRPVMAMLRVPTAASRGMANLHRGAVGIAVRIEDGLAHRAVLGGRVIDRHPDHGAPLTGFHLFAWDEVVDVACRAANAVAIPYLGVDVVLDAESGPQVMEVNLRPGLEIQNVNGIGLRTKLEEMAAAGRKES